MTGRVREGRILDDVEISEKWDDQEVLRLIELYEVDGQKRLRFCYYVRTEPDTGQPGHGFKFGQYASTYWPEDAKALIEKARKRLAVVHRWEGERYAN